MCLFSDGALAFSDIYVEVDGKRLENPQWETVQWHDACGSKAVVDGPSNLRLIWNTSSSHVCIDGQLNKLN